MSMGVDQLKAMATAFVQQYYATYDSNREACLPLYHSTACYSFEGTDAMGHENIKNVFASRQFKTVQHQVTATDAQPVQGGMFIHVIGRLKADDDPIHGFSESFLLKQDGETMFIVNNVFRLELHNM